MKANFAVNVGSCSRALLLPVLTFIALLTASTVTRAGIGYQFVTVGNPANPNDTVPDAQGTGQFSVPLATFTTSALMTSR